MFVGSGTPAMHSSSSAFESRSVFGQSHNPGNNIFVPKPFGGTTTFGSPIGGSMFGGTSTGFLGEPSSLSSTSKSTFDASSSPAFGISSTPTFGCSSSSFSGSSVFGQKPVFGASSTPGFGLSPTPTFGQSTTAFGSSSLFGSTPSPFGTQSSSSGGQARTPTFGSTHFGQSAVGGQRGGSRVASYTGTAGVDGGRLVSVSAMPAYKDKNHEELKWADYQLGDKGVIGVRSSTVQSNPFSPSPLLGPSRSPAFPSSPSIFSSTSPASGFGPNTSPSLFGPSSSPAFSSSPSIFSSTSPTSGFGPNTFPSRFGPSSSPGFASSPSIFSSTSPTSVFGPNTSPSIFGPSSSLGFASSPSIFSSTSPTSVFGPNSSPSLFGPSSSPGFASSPSSFSSTSHTSGFGPNRSPSIFGPSSSPGFASSPSIFSSTSHTSGFGPNRSPSIFGPSSSPGFASSPSIFSSASPTSSLFGPSISPGFVSSPSVFSSISPTSGFGPNSSPSLFRPSISPAFASSPSIFSSTSPTFDFSSVNTISSSIPSNSFTPQTQFLTFPGSVVSTTGYSSPPLSTSYPANYFWTTSPCTPSTSVTVSAPLFGPNSSSSFLGPSNPPSFALSPSILGSTSAPGKDFAFGPNIFSSTSPAFAPSSSILSSTSAPGTDSRFSSGLSPSPLFQPLPLNVSSVPFSSAQTRGSSGDGGVTGGSSQSTTAQQIASQNTLAVQPSSVVSPFGTLPAIPQISVDHAGSTPSLRFGISSIPVSDKKAPVKISSSLTIRHLSLRRNRLPARKYDPKTDGPKVPFFCDDHEKPSRARAESLFIPRANPRALVICPTEQWPLRANLEKLSALNQTSIHLNKDGKVGVEVSACVLNDSIYENENENSDEDSSTQKRDGADAVAMMPKLRSSNYYTEPQIKELAAKERAEPGFCCHVKDFVVGRHGYGSIKFLGYTDVQQLDLESCVQFNNREVIVYMDDSKKPPIGQGLNKAAEVTLLNIKCIDKKTGKQHIDGPKVDKYREMLIKKAVDQGAEFVSFDPAEGVWKFMVRHF